MSDGQVLFLLWAGLCFGPPLAFIAAVEFVRWRNRRNVTDLTEWRELREAQRRHPAAQSNVRRIDRQVRVR